MAKPSPQPVHVKSWLPDGQALEVAAEAMALDPDSRVALKLTPGPFASALRSAVMLARCREPEQDLAHRVVLHVRAPAQLVPDAPAFEIARQLLECAAVLADRFARGLGKFPPGGLAVWAHSPDWFIGNLAPFPPAVQQAGLKALAAAALGTGMRVLVAEGVDARPAASPSALDALRAAHPGVDVRLVSQLVAVAGSLGQWRQSRRAEVHFPIVTREKAALARLEVIVSRVGPAADGGRIDVVGGSGSQADMQRVRAVLAVARDGHDDARHWHTLVRLPLLAHQGHSHELALAVADRIARGREWPGPGRVIATGAIATGTPTGDPAAPPRGTVLDVLDQLPTTAGHASTPTEPQTVSKWQLLREGVEPGDTILLPQSWRQRRRASVAGWQLAGASEWMQPRVIHLQHLDGTDAAAGSPTA